MIDRLIELMEEAHKSWLRYVDECAFNQTPLSFTFEQMFADHLLANGVIVPPCKVGDVLYRLNRLCSAINEATVKAIYISDDKKYFPKSHIIVQYGSARGRVRVNFSELGKTVFLTREEAEKALAEREARDDTKRFI